MRIATAPNEAVAGMWLGILAEHDIDCFLKGRGLAAAMYASPLNQSNEIHLLTSEVGRAEQILAPFLEH